jgi:cytochrome o ubiquinol oxidase subunit 1
LAGAVFILGGIVLTVVQLVVSIRTRDARRDSTGDPWDGRTLEWSMPSPPPAWNFALLPQVEDKDAYWVAKERQVKTADAEGEEYAPLHIPRSNPIGFLLAFCAVVLGFALIWHIWWMAIVGLLGGVAIGLTQAWRTERETTITAEEVADFYGRRSTTGVAS